MHKKLLLILFTTLVLISGCKTSQKTPQEVVEKLGENPYFIFDEQHINKSQLRNYDPSNIATLTTFYGREAINKFGEEAKDGAVVVETKPYAIEKFNSFFSSYSEEYKEMISSTEIYNIQYILNDRILNKDFEGELSLLTKKSLKSLDIIDATELLEQYDIQNKEIGVILKAKK